VQQQWFPPLEQCKSRPGCLEPYEAINNALNDLVNRLQDPKIVAHDQGGNPLTLASLAQSGIFDKLGTDANGNGLTTASFIRYLTSTKPGFFDGTKSTYCFDVLLCGGKCYENAVLNFLLNGDSVEKYFREHSDTAVTGTPSHPLITFVRPSSVLYNSAGKNRGNESLIFHEALHGITGRYDRFTIPVPQGILEKLGYSTNDPSCMIDVAIWDAVLSHSQGLDATTSSCP